MQAKNVTKILGILTFLIFCWARSWYACFAPQFSMWTQMQPVHWKGRDMNFVMNLFSFSWNQPRQLYRCQHVIFNMHTCKCCTNIQVNTGLCLSYIMQSLAVMIECILCLIPQFRMCLAALSMGCKRTQQVPNRRWNRAEFLLLWQRDMLTESDMRWLPA